MADIQNIVIKYTSDTQGITDAEKAYDALTVAEKKATDQVKKLEEQQTELGKARKQVAELSASHERLAQSIKKAQEANNPTAVKSATIAYQELGKKLEIAKQKYQELASKAIEVKNKTKEVTQSTSELSSTLASLASYVTAAFSIGAVINFGKQIYDNTLKMEGLNKRLGMLGDASTEFQYLVDLSNRFGLDLESTADAFSSFAIASTASGLSLAETKKMFEGVSTAITAMQLPAEQSSRVFYALQQMLSKGKVSAEELRQQLGEALPGSFALAVQASGKTEQEFNKLLETGQILAKDFVPKFAAMLGAKYEGSLASSLDTATASTNKLSTAWTLLLTNLGSAGLIKGATDSITQLITTIDNFLQSWQETPLLGPIGIWVNGIKAAQKQIDDIKDNARKQARESAKKADEAMYKEEAQLMIKNALENGKTEKEIAKITDAERLENKKRMNAIAIREGEVHAKALFELQKKLGDQMTAEEAKTLNNQIKIEKEKVAIYAETALLTQTIVHKKTDAEIKAEQQAFEEQKKIILEKNKLIEEQFNREFQMELERLEYIRRERAYAQAGLDINNPATPIDAKAVDLTIQTNDLKLDAEKAYYDSLKSLKDEQSEEDKKRTEADIQAHIDAIEASREMLIGLSMQSVGFINELFANASNAEIKHIEELNAKKVISDQEANRRILAEKRKMFIADKIASASQVAINTLVAISKVGADLGVFGIPLAALVAAQGALAVASILAKPMPFAKGTKSVPDINGQPHKDSVPALLQPREKVFPVSTSTLYEPALDAIFDRRVSPDVANAIARGDNGKKVVVVNDNKEIVRAIKNKETVIINDRALQRAVAYENQNTISRNKRRFHVAR
jgi:tape measure domain-containing protein